MNPGQPREMQYDRAPSIPVELVENFTRSAADETCHIEPLLKLESFNLETDRLCSR